MSRDTEAAQRAVAVPMLQSRVRADSELARGSGSPHSSAAFQQIVGSHMSNCPTATAKPSCWNSRISSSPYKEGFILHKESPRYYSSIPGAGWETAGLTLLLALGRATISSVPVTAGTLPLTWDQGSQCTNPTSLTKSFIYLCKRLLWSCFQSMKQQQSRSTLRCPVSKS